MHRWTGEGRSGFIMQQTEEAQMCWEREILIAYIFKTASLVWMGGTIKQNRAINWGHLESCHFPFCARLFASIQKVCCSGCDALSMLCDSYRGCWGALHRDVSIRTECLTPVLCTGRHIQQKSFLFIWIKWWKEPVMASVLSWGLWNSHRKRRQTNHCYIYR